MYVQLSLPIWLRRLQKYVYNRKQAPRLCKTFSHGESHLLQTKGHTFIAIIEKADAMLYGPARVFLHITDMVREIRASERNICLLPLCRDNLEGFASCMVAEYCENVSANTWLILHNSKYGFVIDCWESVIIKNICQNMTNRTSFTEHT